MRIPVQSQSLGRGISHFKNGLMFNSAKIVAAQQARSSESGSGGKCKVVKGSNKGKTGTFSDNGQWCEGDWGGTECKDSQGNSNGNCEEAALGSDELCGNCFLVASSLKTCSIRTGPGEYATVTVSCKAPLRNCDPCFEVLEERRRCCQGGICRTEPCPLPTPVLPPFMTSGMFFQ